MMIIYPEGTVSLNFSLSVKMCSHVAGEAAAAGGAAGLGQLQHGANNAADEGFPAAGPGMEQNPTCVCHYQTWQ